MNSYLLGVWSMIDPLYFKCSRLCFVPKDEPTKTVFRVRLARFVASCSGVNEIFSMCKSQKM